MFAFCEVIVRLSRKEWIFFDDFVCSVFVAIETGVEGGVLGVTSVFQLDCNVYTRTLGLGVESDDYDNEGIYIHKLVP